MAWFRQSEPSQRLTQVPGIGPITAITMALSVNPANFESGRHFAAWLGLTPKEHSTGGKQKLLGISKRGDREPVKIQFGGRRERHGADRMVW